MVDWLESWILFFQAEFGFPSRLLQFPFPIFLHCCLKPYQNGDFRCDSLSCYLFYVEWKCVFWRVAITYLFFWRITVFFFVFHRQWFYLIYFDVVSCVDRTDFGLRSVGGRHSIWLIWVVVVFFFVIWGLFFSLDLDTDSSFKFYNILIWGFDVIFLDEVWCFILGIDMELLIFYCLWIRVGQVNRNKLCGIPIETISTLITTSLWTVASPEAISALPTSPPTTLSLSKSKAIQMCPMTPMLNIGSISESEASRGTDPFVSCLKMLITFESTMVRPDINPTWCLGKDRNNGSQWVHQSI